jgi:hypothetical protein
MKKIIESTDAIGLESMMGEVVLLLCGNYFYTGKLVALDGTVVELEDASIVYETGEWSASSYKDVKKLGAGPTFVQRRWIEASCRGK